ncbi:MAG: DUF6259 domain-containing protein [Tannerella sp.]|jgi:beta-galactosidase|nr:DUF6259 domain-containing protein [Tannerella sp.]
MKKILFALIVCLSACSLSHKYSAESRDLKLNLKKIGATGAEGLNVVSLTDKRSGREIGGFPASPLFTVIYCRAGHPGQQFTAKSDSAAWGSVVMSKDRIVWKDFSGASGLTVEMHIDDASDKDGIEMSCTAKAGSDSIAIIAVKSQFAFSEMDKLFLPNCSGVVASSNGVNWSAGYPGYSAPMPWFAVWNETVGADGFRSAGEGIYFGFHDAQGSRKILECKTDAGVIRMGATIHAENAYDPDNEFVVGGKMVLRAIRGDWYDGAMLYREWVRSEANWYPREQLTGNGRDDSPEWIKNQCLWAMYRVNPEEMIPAMKRFRDAFGVPAAVHWYYWHKNPYDNDYPHFFPRDGFGNAVREMQKDGDIFIMPYINGLLWDTRDRGMEDWLYTKEGLAAASKDVNGKPNVHSYGSKEADGSDVRLAHECPATQTWKNKVKENVLRLASEYGTKAVYIDQVAAATPEMCFDRSHGHPLGGGHWWGDGYRAMFEEIHAALHEHGLDDVALVTECTGETSLPFMDAFLTWHHQLQGQAPAFAAVYGGAIQMAGRDYRAGNTYTERTAPRMTKTNEPLACRMKAAEALCFGEQIGWFVPTIIDEPDKFPFLKDAVNLRYHVRHYFARGEMCRPPELEAGSPTVTADWNYYASPLITAPAVRTGCWRLTENEQTKSLIAIFANTSSEDVTSEVKFDIPDGFNPLSVTLINPDGSRKPLTLKVLKEKITFPKESVFAIELTDKQDFPAFAYMSYLGREQYYKEAAEAGIHLYCFPAYLGDRGINSTSGIGPFRKPIWTGENQYDYSELETDFKKVLKADTDAQIIIRLYLDPPLWWEKAHPEGACQHADGTTFRQCFFSDVWREATAKAMNDVVKWLLKSEYADNLIGIHVAAGSTEEWFYHSKQYEDINPARTESFRKWLYVKYATDAALQKAWNTTEATLQTAIPFDIHTDKHENRWRDTPKEQKIIDTYLFHSETLADNIVFFCKEVKKTSGGKLLTGVFYGYHYFVTDPRWGHAALYKLLDCEDIDYFSSPNDYNRVAGEDWAPFVAIKSLQLHGKRWMAENDTRTCKTTLLKNQSSGIAPPGQYYESGVWFGPEDMQTSVALLWKNTGRMLAYGYGGWWFDMWGGWFSDPQLLEVISKSNLLCDKYPSETDSDAMKPQVAVVVDEYLCVNDASLGGMTGKIYTNRYSLGKTGASYDLFLRQDIEKIDHKQYKVIWLQGFLSLTAEDKILIDKWKQQGITVMLTDGEGSYISYPNDYQKDKFVLSTSDLRIVFQKSGVHIYDSSGDVLYAGRGWLCIHTVNGGKRTINLPFDAKVINAQTDRILYHSTRQIEITLQPMTTMIFKVHPSISLSGRLSDRDNNRGRAVDNQDMCLVEHAVAIQPVFAVASCFAAMSA